MTEIRLKAAGVSSFACLAAKGKNASAFATCLPGAPAGGPARGRLFCCLRFDKTSESIVDKSVGLKYPGGWM